jgi:hypothetical protein
MVGYRSSIADQSVFYNAPPADVAEEILKALKSVGSVKQVSRESGVISGKVRLGMGMGANAKVMINIQQSGSGTQVNFQTQRDEGAISTNGADKALMKLLGAISQTSLKGAGGSGW